MRNLMPIGQFSQVSRLSVKALRLYDEEGLLKPAFVASESGYRYYGAAQLIEAEKIRLLREVGMPLDDIRTLLVETDPDSVRLRLVAHRNALEARMAALQSSLAFVQQLLVEEESILTRYEMRRRRMEPLRVARRSIVTSKERIGRDLGRAYAELCRWIFEQGAQIAGSAIAIYPDPEFDPKSFTVEACMPVEEELYPSGGFDMTTLPGCEVAFTLHVGPYSQIPAAFAALFRMVEDEGLRATGAPFEVYLNCPESVASPAELRTEIAMPVA